jgi:hypothetical protein
MGRRREMRLPEEAVKTLGGPGVKEMILNTEARQKFKPGTQAWDRAMNAARALLGLRTRDTNHLADFLTLSAKEDAPYVVCISCGLPVAKESQTVTRGPKEILDEAVKFNQLLSGLYLSLSLRSPSPKIPIKNLRMINGFCEICQGSREIPARFRIGGVPPISEPVSLRTNSVEEAILFLHHNHVVFDEDRFRIVWKRSIQMNL